MPPNIGQLQSNPITQGLRDNEADRRLRQQIETEEQALLQQREGFNRSVALDEAGTAAVREANGPNAGGRSLNTIAASQLSSRGLGQEAFAAGQQAEAATTAAEVQQFDDFVGALRAGDVAGAGLIASQSGEQMTPGMQAAIADVAFQRDLAQAWDRIQAQFKNQPAAIGQAFDSTMEALLQRRAQGGTGPVNPQLPQGAAVTPSVGGDKSAFTTMTLPDGRVVRVPRDGGDASVVNIGGDPLNVGDPNATARRQLDDEASLFALAANMAETMPGSYVVNDFNERTKDPVRFAENQLASFNQLKQTTGLGTQRPPPPPPSVQTAPGGQGVSPTIAIPGAPQRQPPPSVPQFQQPQAGASPFAQMSLQELLAVPPDSLSGPDLEAAARRYTELTGIR